MGMDYFKPKPQCRCLFCGRPVYGMRVVIGMGTSHKHCWNSNTYEQRRDRLFELAKAKGGGE